MTPVNELVLPSRARAQADGDPGYPPVVYVDRRGTDKAVGRPEGQTDREFSAEHDLHVCHDCKKYCEPAMTEEYGNNPSVYFCYLCDFASRVRVLVGDGMAGVDTAGALVYRMIAYETPSCGMTRVVVTR